MIAPLARSVLGPDLPQAPFSHPFRSELHDWLVANAPSQPEPLDQEERFEFRRRWHRELAANGWVALHWPAEYGGRGADPLTQFMYYEEMALARAPELANTPGILLLGPTLMRHGTAEMCRRFLPGILSGDDIWCQGFSEPDSGSDLASLRTRAELGPDGWHINGQKTWTTFGQYADYCFVLCRTEAGSERHRGLSLLVCPTDQPGVTRRPIRQITGETEFCECFFDDALAPADWLVGDRGQGWRAAMTLFQFERADQGYTDHARPMVQLHDAAGDLRAGLGSGLISSARASEAVTRHAELWMRSQELRRINLRSAVMASRGEDLGAVGSLSNLLWGELDKDIAHHRADLAAWGGLDPADHRCLDRLASRAKTIYSGTSEIQRNIIAERLLGLPR